MTYGIQIKNNYGDRVLNSGGLLFEKTTGTMVFVDRRYLNGYQYGDQLDITNREGGVLSINSSRVSARWEANTASYTVSNLTDGGSFNNNSFSNGSIMQVNSNSYVLSYQPTNFSQQQDYNRIRYAVPSTDDRTYHYEAFFKIPTQGLHNWSSYYNPYDYLFNGNNKGLHLNATASSLYTSGIDYVVAWDKKPPLTSDTYGMQVLNGDGSTHYDTRFSIKALRIKDYVRITASEFQDCLDNGTTYDFTLRQPISNAYIGGGAQYNFKDQWVYRNGHYYYRPTFKMTSTTNLRMYRTTYKYSSGGNIPAGVRSRYDECLVTLLDY